MPAMESKNSNTNTEVQNEEVAKNESTNNVVKEEKENHKNVEDLVSFLNILLVIDFNEFLLKS